MGLGSNLGDRVAHLNHAISRLQTLLAGLRISTFYETTPVGVPGPQPAFLNAAAVGDTTLSPRTLLETLMAIEAERGRERPYRNAPRTLDLDLLLVGEVMVDEPGLVLPHPGLRDRRFVLEPLAEIAPDVKDPVSGLTIAELFTRLRDRAS